GPTSFAIEIRRVSGTSASHLKWMASPKLSTAVPAEYADAEGIDPDGSSARGALTVGAVRHSDPGLNDPESFSSRGPTVTRYLDKDGKRLPTPDVRQKPDVAGADGVATSLANPNLNPFFGTSTAPPSVAGVAPLVLRAK